MNYSNNQLILSPGYNKIHKYNLKELEDTA